MIKKKEDGCYYEKIVTWKKKPRRWTILTMMLSLCSIYFVGDFMQGVRLLDILPRTAHRLVVSTAVTLLFVGLIFGVLFSIFFFFGEGRKVKYRRVGK